MRRGRREVSEVSERIRYGDPGWDDFEQWGPDEERPPATEAEAHAEWHRNSGVPMGTPGCPQDACHPAEEPEEDAEVERDRFARSLAGLEDEAFHEALARWDRAAGIARVEEEDDLPF